MVTRCSFGFHKYLLSDEEVFEHPFFKGYHEKRNRVIYIETCACCGKKRAFRYATNPATATLGLEVAYAESEIARIRKENEE